MSKVSNKSVAKVQTPTANQEGYVMTLCFKLCPPTIGKSHQMQQISWINVGHDRLCILFKNQCLKSFMSANCAKSVSQTKFKMFLNATFNDLTCL